MKYLLPVLKFLYLTCKMIAATMWFFIVLIFTVAIGILGGDTGARRRR